MLERLKNWLIKRLGGYTKEEYDDQSRFPIMKPDFRAIARTVRHTVDLRAERIVYREEFMTLGQQEAELRTRAEIARELASAAMPYIAWEQCENRLDLAVRVRGTLTVLEER